MELTATNPTKRRPGHSLKMLLVNGVLCRIELRRSHRNWPNGSEYVRFDITRGQGRALGNDERQSSKAVRDTTNPVDKCFVRLYIPADGKYASANSKKPRKDWTRFEDAWHLLR